LPTWIDIPNEMSFEELLKYIASPPTLGDLVSSLTARPPSVKERGQVPLPYAEILEHVSVLSPDELDAVEQVALGEAPSPAFHRLVALLHSGELQQRSPDSQP